MKKVKFAIFTMFLFFISLGSVSATTFNTYENSNILTSKNVQYDNMNISLVQNGNITKTYYGSPNANASDDDLDLDNFCEGNVLVVFRVFGYIINVIKIAVPILLIAFGTIDLGKAIISSKADELQKAIKTLAIRGVAGVVIFFVPSFIFLLIQVIGGEDVFDKNSTRNDSSQFGACTYCLFNPQDDVCGSIKN